MKLMPDCVRNAASSIYPHVKSGVVQTKTAIVGAASSTAAITKGAAIAYPLTTTVLANTALAAIAFKIGQFVADKLFNNAQWSDTTKGVIRHATALTSVALVNGVANYALLSALGLSITTVPVALAVAGGALMGITIVLILNEASKKNKEAKLTNLEAELDQKRTELRQLQQDRAAAQDVIENLFRLETTEVNSEKVDGEETEIEVEKEAVLFDKNALNAPAANLTEVNDKIAKLKKEITSIEDEIGNLEVKVKGNESGSDSSPE